MNCCATGCRSAEAEKWPRRTILNAIFYFARGGIAWASLPAGFPPAGTVYWWFANWARQGVWQRVHDALRDQLPLRLDRHPEPSAAIIDAQTIRASGQVHETVSGYNAGKKVKGRKGHIAVDTNGLLLALVITAASTRDRDGAIRVMPVLGGNDSPRRTVSWGAALGDAAHGEQNRGCCASLRRNGARGAAFRGTCVLRFPVRSRLESVGCSRSGWRWLRSETVKRGSPGALGLPASSVT
ncbi:MAG: transposase [Microbacterium sp.]